MDEISPMMRQYLETKKDYPDTLLFYRIGDFYEMFYDDALTASKELELTLTKKANGTEEKAPMCGVPHHAVDTYVNRLIKKGYKVAICEQVEDPKLAKGLVKRDVIRIVTPGTNIDFAGLDETRNNYIMSIVQDGPSLGIALSDITTGEFSVTGTNNVNEFINLIDRLSPAEIIANKPFFSGRFFNKAFFDRAGIHPSEIDKSYFDIDETVNAVKKQFKVESAESLGLSDRDVSIRAAGALLLYLYDTQKIEMPEIRHLNILHDGDYMILDLATRRNLELTETMRDKDKRGSLLWVLDETKTAAGARRLRNWVIRPLLKKEDIEERLDSVEEFYSNIILRENLRDELSGVYDLERLLTRISYRTASPKDLIAFKNSISTLPVIISALSEVKSVLNQKIFAELDPLRDIYDLLDRAIIDDPPFSTHEGGIIKTGYDVSVDELREAETNGKTWLSELEAKEREKTDIKNLKIKYNKVFGYYLEVSNSFKDKVPDYFIRKQTLVNAERFYTPELKELENKILGSSEKLISVEKDIFNDVLSKIINEAERIQKTAQALSILDALLSLAHIAEKNHFVRPVINTDGIIDIKEGRHPVIEKMRPNEPFISNDTYLDGDMHRISIITGPNMAGKSTYMRQTALIVLMAQLGSFVPAASANIGIVDRVFTRVGASDDLSSGQSTFMVEMNEVSNILKNATKDSLLILDEIGRGTSTYDGLSIAWAVVEYIEKHIGAKTLFATHYHELTELEGKLDGVDNYCSSVKENGKDLVFLRKIIKGGADKSYGIAVARLAGLPGPVLKRADQISTELRKNDISGSSLLPHDKNFISGQYSLFDSIASSGDGDDSFEDTTDDMPDIDMYEYETDKAIVDELRGIDINAMTPIEAMNTLAELIDKIK